MTRAQLRLGAALAVLATGAAAQDPVELTMWSWLPDLQTQIDMFEAQNPGITVNLENVGQGEPHYVAMRNAIRAGTGGPDVVHVEFQLQPSFQLTGALLDLGPLGAEAVRGDYVDWSMAQVTGADGGIYGMPWDSGPLGIVYRGDLFEAAGITEPPATWDAFAEAARAYRAANPDSYITTAPFNQGGWVNALFWQAGSRPFEMVDADTIRIRINDEAAKKVADYWSGLIADDLVDTQADFTTEWYSALDQGRIASWITAGWGPVFLSGFASESAGAWRAMPVPQWDPANPASANWGGSTIAVMAGTEYPEEAAKLALFLSNNAEAANSFATKQFLFPVLDSVLGSEAFLNATSDFYGGTAVNGVFADSSALIDTSFQWSPFQDFVFSEMSTTLGAAAAEKRSLSDALDQVQASVVEYAESQGFEVVQ